MIFCCGIVLCPFSAGRKPALRFVGSAQKSPVNPNMKGLTFQPERGILSMVGGGKPACLRFSRRPCAGGVFCFPERRKSYANRSVSIQNQTENAAQLKKMRVRFGTHWETGLADDRITPESYEFESWLERFQ
jgi:hypothetical protein